MKVEMEFYDKTLFINLMGNCTKRELKSLKHKLYYIINEYGIDSINIDITKVSYIDKIAFYAFLDEYDINYGGNLELIKK